MLSLGSKGKRKSANLVTPFLNYVIIGQQRGGECYKKYFLYFIIVKKSGEKERISYRFDSNPCVAQNVLVLRSKARHLPVAEEWK